MTGFEVCQRSKESVQFQPLGTVASFGLASGITGPSGEAVSPQHERSDTSHVDAWSSSSVTDTTINVINGREAFPTKGIPHP